MHFSITNFTCRLIFFINLYSLSYSDPRINEARLLCGTSRPTTITTFLPIFVREMEIISQQVTSNNWARHHLNSTPPIYGLAQCYQDLSHTDCLSCYAASRTRLPRCLPYSSARIFLDGCFLRYDSYDFYNETLDPSRDTVICNGTNEGTQLEFRENVRYLIGNLSGGAPRNGGFGIMEHKGVFGLAQCWKSLSSDECRVCLENAGEMLRGCLPKAEGRGLNAGCYFRYSTHKFYNTEADYVNKSSGGSKTGITVAIAVAALAFLMLSLFSVYAAYVRWSNSKKERKNLGTISNLFNKSNLNFKYETLEKATNYFNISRKIGQGGSGSVFRGTLQNGTDVAVKRLFFNTRQWVDEFFNEVNLISGIQHKNLVKLLGCSLEGPESLLVYEFVHNKSLDQFLFDKSKDQLLSWKQRFDIIVGIAEGLAHLHGGCEVRIIHRDIKSSNVLLDENLAPKIADFGLVRCFGEDKTHLSTGIAGTLGYMAPEYLVRGQLTEKADVYSFGVLVLEIVCGIKNNSAIDDSGSLLEMVWKLYKIDKLGESVERSVEDDFPMKQACNVLRIGLLCTQASAALRPSMNEVVQMLTQSDYEIPSPNQPPFLSGGMNDPPTTSRSYSTNSVTSSALTKIDASYSSTESSSVQSSAGQQTQREVKS